MKRILLVMVLIFSLSVFTGCNEENRTDVDNYIMLSLDVSSNGQVIQSVNFSVNSDVLDSLGVDEVEKNQFIISLQEQISQIRTEFLMNFALIYITNPNEEFSINKGLLFSDVAYNATTDSVGFDMLFTSIGAWNFYHNSSQSSNPNQEEGLFYSKNLSQGNFPFSSEINLGDGESIYVGEHYRQKYLQAMDGLSFSGRLEEEYNPTLIYNYSTFYSRMHSDADLKYTDDIGHTHHVWLVESNSLTGDNKITIATYQVHSGAWYLFALIFTVILGIILYVILDFQRIKCYFKSKKDNYFKKKRGENKKH